PSLFPRMEQTLTLATPGQSFTLTAHLYNRSKVPLTAFEIKMDLPQQWESTVLKQNSPMLEPGDTGSSQFQIKVPEAAPYARPYWSRKDSETENIYTIQYPGFATLPLPPYPVHVTANYRTATGSGQAHVVAMVKFVDPVAGQSQRPLAVGPPLSLLMKRPLIVVPTHGGGA